MIVAVVSREAEVRPYFFLTCRDWVLAFCNFLRRLGNLVAGFLAMRMRRRSGDRVSNADLPSFDSSLAEQLPSFEEHPMLESAPGIAAPIRSAADLTREQMIEYVTEVANETPESIVKLVKLWLAE